MAVSLVAGGSVRVNRIKTGKPGHALRPGDIVTVALHGKVRVLRVAALAERRGQATDAARLYDELAEGEGLGRNAKKDGANGPETC